MSLENSQDIDVVSDYSVDDSIFSENQLSYIGIGNFGDGSSLKWIVRQGFCMLDDPVNKIWGSLGTVLRYEILYLEQP